MADISRYIESGYVEAGYYEVLVEPQRYHEVGYVELGYTEGPDFFVTSSVTAELTELTNIEGSGTFSSSFSVSFSGGLLLVADATVDAAVSTTASPVKTVSASADFGGLFSPTVVTGTIKRIDANLSVSISMNATISKFTGNEATLSNIISLSLQGDKFVGYNASFTASFAQSISADRIASTDATLSTTSTLTATPGQFLRAVANLASEFAVTTTPRVLVRNTSVTNTNSTYITFDSGIKQFGTHSLDFTNATFEQPTSNILYVGSTYYVFANGFTWTSSNGTTWSRATNDLTGLTFASQSKVKYLDSKFIVRSNENVYYSTNGTSWSSIDLSGPAGVITTGDTIAYDGTNWWVGATTSVRFEFYKSTTLQDNLSNWTLDTFISAGSNRTNLTVHDVVSNGSTIAWTYQAYHSTNNYYEKRIRIGSSNYNISNDDYRFEEQSITFINSLYTILAHEVTTNSQNIYTTTNGSSIATTTISNSNIIQWIDYFNSKYIAGTDNNQVLIGTALNSLSDLNAPFIDGLFDSYNTPGASDGSDYVFHPNNGSIFVTNGSTTTEYSNVSGSEQTPFVTISRGDNSDFDSWKTIDFRWYRHLNNAFFMFQKNSSGIDERNWQVFANQSGVSIADGTNNYSTGNVGFTTNAWHHVRIVNDNGVSIWVNGTRYVNQQSFSLSSSGRPITLQASTGTVNIDELLVSDDALSSHSEATITVPSTAFQNGLNTDLLMHFDGDFTDDSRFSSTVDPEIDITAVASVTAGIGGSFFGTSSINSAFTQTATAQVIKIADSTINSAASLSATALRIHDSGVVDCDIASTVSTTAVKQATASSSANIAFTTQIDGNAIRNAIGDFDSIATQLTAVSKIGDFLIDCDVTATVSASAEITASANATLSTQSSVSITPDLFKTYSATASSAFAMTTVNNVVLDPVATLSSAFTQSTTGQRVRFGVGSFAGVFNLSADNSTTKDVDAVLSSSFNQPSTNIVRIRSGVATVDSVATVSADVIKAVSASATLTTAITQTADANRIRDFDCDFDSVATQLTAVAKIGDFLCDADVVSSLTVVAIKTAGNVVACDSAFTLSADVGIIKQGESTQSSAFTLTGEGTSNITADASFGSAITVSVSATKTIEAGATLAGAGGFVVTAVATRNNEILANSVFTLSASVGRIRLVESTLASAITAQITATKRVNVTSQINSSVTISATGRIVNINDIVYTIPAETREASIVAETREYTIVAETREVTVT